ncbi:ABC transporter permease [Oceanispirochaeta crateris]|uniref:ABC transporter permease n=1 Tax=Oceanispirochaeta crateris TaxID=2518645 RepID=A0A5C1QNX9_9SPIO|nr:ABC transporter permease [Oceanispirochaeta crateris]QEN08264.1 ABC transporter permease [Oceanispirochaeta crateris]
MKNRRFEIFKEELKNDKWAIFAFVLLIIMILASLLAPLLPHDPNEVNISLMKDTPSLTHWFGTDELGRDYFTRVLYGGRVSLMVGILAMMTSVIIGTLIGTVSGYWGGAVENILMRFVDVLSAIPWMILVTIISIFIQGGIWAIIIVIGGFSWMGAARLVRAETLSLKQREYVLYASASGERNYRIIRKHILPGIYPTIVVTATIFIPHAIIIESTLSFLGLGVKAPTSSWGSMLKNAQGFLMDVPHLAIIPGLMILIIVYCFNKLGDVLRAVVEPKTMGA